jgi:hypothetical protein
MSTKLRAAVAVALLFGSASTIPAAASHNGKTAHHEHGYAMRRVAPQSWSRSGFTDPECGFAGIKDYGPNGYQPCDR